MVKGASVSGTCLTQAVMPTILKANIAKKEKRFIV
jgi:hypothetical protein